jgi:hypothetical protein
MLAFDAGRFQDRGRVRHGTRRSSRHDRGHPCCRPRRCLLASGACSDARGRRRRRCDVRSDRQESFRAQRLSFGRYSAGASNRIRGLLFGHQSARTHRPAHTHRPRKLGLSDHRGSRDAARSVLRRFSAPERPALFRGWHDPANRGGVCRLRYPALGQARTCRQARNCPDAATGAA